MGEATGACAADMESAAIARVAANAGIPFIAIRAIVDPIYFSPPDALLSAVYPDGGVDFIRLISLLINQSVPPKTFWSSGNGNACSTLYFNKSCSNCRNGIGEWSD